jgi:hypothetical protein
MKLFGELALEKLWTCGKIYYLRRGDDDDDE